MEKLENVKNISTTFFIFSYISLSFPVIACNSCHCVKQNAKQNQNAAHKSVPLGTRGPIDTTHPPPPPPPHPPCYATARVWASRPLWLRTDNLKWELTSQQQLGKLVKFCIIIHSEYFVSTNMQCKLRTFSLPFVWHHFNGFPNFRVFFKDFRGGRGRQSPKGTFLLNQWDPLM